MKSDIELYDILAQVRRNIIWAGQGQIDVTTNMHIGTTLHLIELALSILKERTTPKSSK